MLTRPGFEPRKSGPQADMLTIKPCHLIVRFTFKIIYSQINKYTVFFKDFSYIYSWKQGKVWLSNGA